MGADRVAALWRWRDDRQLQEKKRALAAATLSGDKLKNMRLGIDELVALFRASGHDDDEED